MCDYPCAFLTRTSESLVAYLPFILAITSRLSHFILSSNCLFITLTIAFRLVRLSPIQIPVCPLLLVHLDGLGSKLIMVHHNRRLVDVLGPLSLVVSQEIVCVTKTERVDIPL